MRMSRSMSTFAMTRSVDAEDLGTSGTLEFAAGETKTVKINGMTYTITLTDSSQSGILNFETVNDQIRFDGYKFDVVAADGQADNIYFGIYTGSLNTGDMDDIIVYAGGSNGEDLNLSSGDGNDNIVVSNFKSGSLNIDSGSGVDNLTIDMSDIDTSLLNITNTESIIEDLGTSGSREFAAGETATVMINGLIYTISNTGSSSSTFTCSTDTTTGKITVTGTNLTITAAEGQKDNIYVYSGSNIVVNTGDENDIVSVGSNATVVRVYTGDGADILDNGSNAIAVADLGEGSDIYKNGTLASDSLFTNAEQKVTGVSYLGNSGSFSFSSGVTEAVLINGQAYTVTNNSDSSQTLTYSVDENGQITFDSSGALNLTAHENQEDNILLTGKWGSAYTGNMDDTIVLSGSVGFAFGSGAGNNNITITETGYTNGLHAGSGNDNITIDGTVNGGIIFANQGNDNITINSDNITVEGEGGTDTVYNNGTGNTFVGVENVVGNSGTIQVKAGETITVEIDGKKYDIINSADSTKTVSYSVSDGVITFDSNDTNFDGSTGLSIWAHEGQTDNIALTGNWFHVSTRDGNDTIHVTETGKVWGAYGYEGDDTIDVDGEIFGAYGYDGNDTLTVNGTANFVAGDDGSDTININGTVENVDYDAPNNFVLSGGNDTININGTVNGTIYGGADGDSISIAAGETVTIDINGKKYDVNNSGSSTQTVTYSLNDGQITFENNATSFEDMFLTAHDAQEDNILLKGAWNQVSTGNMNDTVIVDSGQVICVYDGDGDDVIVVNQSAYLYSSYISNGNDNITISGEMNDIQCNSADIEGNDTITVTETGRIGGITAGSGDDTITVEGTVTNDINAGDGDDIIVVTQTGSVFNAYGDGGNDTIFVEGSVVKEIWGDDNYVASGNDNITINSDGNTIIGGDGDDIVTLNGKDNVAYGGNETTDTSTNDTVYINNTDNTVAGFENIYGNSGTVNVKAGETVTVEIDGKKYDIRNDSSSTGTVSYALAEDGIINFTGSSTEQSELYLLAHENQEDKVKVDGFSNIDLGNYDDTLIVDGTIYGATMGLGNDTVTVTEGSVVTRVIDGGDGDDTITVEGTSGYITAGDGNDTITVEGKINQDILGGAGNDNITIAGTLDNGVNSTVDGCEGNDTITVTSTGSAWYAYGGEDDDNITIDGIIWGYTRGDEGNDNITVNSDGNIIYGDVPSSDGIIVDDQNDTIIINSDRNTIYAGNSDDTVILNGKDNTAYGGNDVTDTSTNDTVYINNTDNTVSGFENIVGNSGTINVKDGETVTVEIDGKKYDIENVGSGGYDLDVSYSVNNGQITFVGEADANGSNGLTITAHEDQEDNIIIDGEFWSISTGNHNDTITIKGRVANNYISGGVLAGTGSDVINVLEGAYASSIGYTADDTEADTINIGGTVSHVYSSDAGSTINVTSTGYADDIIGGAGQDVITVDGRVGEIRSDFSSTGVIGDTITINGTAGDVLGGNGADTITINGSVGDNVRGLGGDDTIVINQGASVNGVGGGEGDDNVTIEGTIYYASTGTGNDIITVTSTGVVTGYVEGNEGDDTITVSGTVSSVMGDDGNDSITLTSSASVNVIKTGYGEDYLKVDANNTNIELGEGKNDVIINGSENMIVSSFGVSSGIDNNITINGDWNEVDFSSMDSGVDKVNINGDDNVVNTGGGDDNINIYGDNNTVDASAGDDLTSVVAGTQNMVFGGTGYDRVANYASKTVYSEMDELINGGSNYRVQIDGNISESSGYNMDLSMSLPPDAVFDISSVENAQNSLLQIDELIGQLTKQRGQISFQNTMLKEILDSNLARLTNLNNSLSTVRDADTAAEYNSLLAKASLIEQGQLLQAQLLESNASVVTQLIGGIAS